MLRVPFSRPHGARVTSSSDAVGWIATHASRSAFVQPICRDRARGGLRTNMHAWGGGVSEPKPITGFNPPLGVLFASSIDTVQWGFCNQPEPSTARMYTSTTYIHYQKLRPANNQNTQNSRGTCKSRQGFDPSPLPHSHGGRCTRWNVA